MTTTSEGRQERGDTAAAWTAANPVLLAREIGYETDTHRFKMGNGTATWNQLGYFFDTITGDNRYVNEPATGTPSASTFLRGDGAWATPSGGSVTQYTDEMAQDAIAQAFANGTQTGITFVYDDTANSLSAMVNSAGGGSGDSATPYGTVSLDSFTGSTDDAKLDAALALVGADTYPRTIQFEARAHTFATAGRTAFTGMRLQGPAGYSNPERGSGKQPQKITLNMTGAWFVANATNYSVSLHNLSFIGGSSAQVLGGTANWYCLSLRDIFASGLKSVLGSYAQPLVITAASFTGDWEINNSGDTAFHLQGSDNSLWTDGMLLDSNTAYQNGSNTGHYHLWCDQLEKTYIGPIYITCEGNWGGLKVTGNPYNSTSNNQGGPIWVNGARIEGRNAGAPCNGANIRQDGGILSLNQCWVAYGYANTSSFAQGDLGVIHHSGGTLVVDQTTYDRASSVAETVPFIYTASTGDAQVSHLTRASKGGTWVGRPRVAKGSGSENRIVDGTATLV